MITQREAATVQEIGEFRTLMSGVMSIAIVLKEHGEGPEGSMEHAIRAARSLVRLAQRDRPLFNSLPETAQDALNAFWRNSDSDDMVTLLQLFTDAADSIDVWIQEQIDKEECD